MNADCIDLTDLNTDSWLTELVNAEYSKSTDLDANLTVSSELIADLAGSIDMLVWVTWMLLYWYEFLECWPLADSTDLNANFADSTDLNIDFANSNDLNHYLVDPTDINADHWQSE